jgi:hypothetical protein
MPDKHAEPFLDFFDVFDVERYELGASERAGKAE